MKHFHTRSLRFRLTAFIILVFVLLLALIMTNNLIVFREIQNKIYASMQETLVIYQNRLTQSCETTENYLKNYAYDDGDVRIIEKNDLSSEQYFSAIYHIQKSFSSALNIYDMDGFFLYSVTGDTYIEKTQSDITYDKYKNIQNVICDKMKTNTLLTKNNNGKWFSLIVNGKYYLFRVYKIHNSYIGCWVGTDKMLQPLVGKKLNQSVLLVKADGTVISNHPPIKIIPKQSLKEQEDYQYIDIEAASNLIVSCKMKFGDLYIVSLIPESQFMMDVNKYIPFVILIIALALCLMSLVGYIINQWVLHPLNRLNLAINALKSGDLDTKVPVEGVCVEYEGVNNAFNEMVGEIKTLKIDVYEEKLVRQKIHTQYLKLQITPHFLINCLSMVYQLAEINRTDLVQLMLKNLSNYLRYTLSSGQTVTLEQELTHVDNYIELSKIRYPNSISFHSEISPETLQATVIPLLLQSFIENTIKYEVILGKMIEIHICTSILQKENNAFISITIWDTGGGFSKEILERLQNIDQYLYEESTKHIGISNVLQRTYLQFDPENCDFHFSNRPEGGAQINIVLPYIPCVIKEETF